MNGAVPRPCDDWRGGRHRDPAWTWWTTDAEPSWHEVMTNADSGGRATAVDLFGLALGDVLPATHGVRSTTPGRWCTPGAECVPGRTWNRCCG